MYTKKNLIADIEKYQPFDATEFQHKNAALNLLNGTDHCFMRNDFPGHFIGAAWVISSDGKKVLLAKHKILKSWLPLGGHVDGEIDIKIAAMREVKEESDIQDVIILSNDILDIDVHNFPANEKKGEPAHTHYVVSYLMRAPQDNFIMSSELDDLSWFSCEELEKLIIPEFVKRSAKKWSSMQNDKTHALKSSYSAPQIN